MPVVNKSVRSSLGIMKLWLTDHATFPVIMCAGFAAVLGTAMGIRFAFNAPDVYFDKHKRVSSMHFDGDNGSTWRKFRFRMANIKRNPINQSRQFDDLFDKAENQDVKR